MNHTTHSIFSTIKSKRQKLKNFGVKNLYLFGSIVRNQNNPDSDIDVLVELKEKTFDSYMNLKFFLEDLFDCKVDLVLKDALKPQLKDQILKEAIHVPEL